MTSKVIVITGGIGGIGYQAATFDLISHPEKHTVVVMGRSPDSAENAVASLTNPQYSLP